MGKSVIVLTVLFVASLQAAKLNVTKPRVCVIGAGVGGLSSARYLKDADIDFVVLEATSYVGGTWRYEDRVGSDEYGLPIYTSMYKDLRTNLPKAAMGLPGFPIPQKAPSYFSGDTYYNYLTAFAKHFDLEKHIKFLHQVTSVKKIRNLWKVNYKNVRTGNTFEEDFEYVFVATGHLSTPHLPIIPGEKLFNGTIIHSHDYRDPERYKCRRVLLIGFGPTGMDLALTLSEVSKTLVHSHHSKFKTNTPFPSNYVKKPNVKELNETGVIFEDGSFEEIDDIIYCTGYEYHYPFLDESSGLTISRRMVSPLHKCVLNINEPTMVILGAVTRACIVIALDAQARYATALVKGDFSPPAREVMMDALEERYKSLRSEGKPMYFIHFLGKSEDQYYVELTKESGVERVKPVLSKIHTSNMRAIIENMYTFRNYNYTVIDDETFTRTYMEEKLPPRNITCSSK